MPRLREQLEDQQRRDRPRVRAVEVVEVVVAGHLAAEHGVLLAHPGLEEGVPDPVHQRAAACLLGHVLDRPARPDVVQDRRAGVLLEHRLGEQRGQEVAVDERALVVDEEAAVGVPVPGDAQLGRSGARPRA